MPSVSITPQLASELETFRAYFRFETKRALKKFPLLWIGLTILILGTLGIVRPFFLFLAICVFAALLVFLGYYLIRVLLRRRIFERDLTDQFKHRDMCYDFLFDENGMIYQTKNQELITKWEHIESFDENRDQLYLFTGNRQLNNIISRQQLGDELFMQFQLLLEKKMNEKIAVSSANE